MLIIDDNFPDGTYRIVGNVTKTNKKVFLFKREDYNNPRNANTS